MDFTCLCDSDSEPPGDCSECEKTWILVCIYTASNLQDELGWETFSKQDSEDCDGNFQLRIMSYI